MFTESELLVSALALVVFGVLWLCVRGFSSPDEKNEKKSEDGAVKARASKDDLMPSAKSIPEIKPGSASEGNVPDIVKAGSLTEFITDLHKRFGTIAAFWMKDVYIVSIAGPDLFGEILHLFDRPNVLFADFIPLIGEASIQFANGESGQKRRKLHDRSFAHDKLIAKIPLFQEIGEELCSRWEKMADSEEHIPLTLNSSAIVMRALTRFAFGDYFKDEEALNSFRKDYDYVFWILENSLVEGPLVPGSEREKEFKEGLARMRTVVKEIIRQREEAEIAADEKIFIDSLLDEYDNEDMLFSDVLTYLIGGSHTTGFFVFWVLYHLANNPDMQDRCYKEICEVYSGGPITLDMMRQLKYLHCVMSETHRFTNVGPFAARYSEQDLTLGGYHVPANTPIMISLYAMFKDEKQWPNAEIFNPDRFLDRSHIPPLGFEPFSSGKRKCPGYRMTEMEAPTFLILILKRFKISLVPGQSVGHKYGILTKPDCEIYVTVQKRE